MLINEALEFLESSFLRQYLNDEDITDLSYNGDKFFKMDNKYGRKELPLDIPSDEVNNFLRQIANLCEKKFNFSDPILDVSFGKYRLNAIHSSIGRDANKKVPTFSLRIESSYCRLVKDDSFFPEGSKEILKEAILNGESIVIGGKTGAGKTELQKYLLTLMPNALRVIVIDNVEELSMFKLNNLDLSMWLYGEGKASSDNLIRNALRSNPDYIIVAEARGKEAYDVLTSAMSGHPIITTIHAASLEQMPKRLSNMAFRYSSGLEEKELRNVFSEHIRYYVYLKREEVDGRIYRHIEHIGRLVNEEMEVLL